MTIEWVDEGDCWRAVVDHGLFDRKGRRIGGVAQINVDDRPGTSTPGKYVVRVNAARNGRTYGASSELRVYETIDAAKSGAAVALLAQRGRYNRQFRGGSRWR